MNSWLAIPIISPSRETEQKHSIFVPSPSVPRHEIMLFKDPNSSAWKGRPLFECKSVCSQANSINHSKCLPLSFLLLSLACMLKCSKLSEDYLQRRTELRSARAPSPRQSNKWNYCPTPFDGLRIGKNDLLTHIYVCLVAQLILIEKQKLELFYPSFYAIIMRICPCFPATLDCIRGKHCDKIIMNTNEYISQVPHSSNLQCSFLPTAF